ncbi:MAG: hypothetical protein ACOYKJ_03505 [Candidatus Howiella sp.]|jgi:hypothetical protein
MKARKSLALLLALCMVVSMFPIASLSAVAASSTLDEGRITYYDQLYDYVDVNNCSSTIGTVSNLFDKTFNKMEGGWSGSCTVVVKMTQAVKVTAYTMATNDDGSWNNRAPTTWTVSGSNDGAEYTVIDTVTDHPVLNVSNVYWEDDLRVDNPGEYLYYKWEITACAGTYFQIGELVLSGYDLTALTAVEAQIDALPTTITATEVEAVRAARTAYDALGAVKASVQNGDKLLTAEAQADAAAAEDAEKASAATIAINAIGTVTYKSSPAIAAAQAAWDALSENDKTLLASYGTKLEEAKTGYQNIINNFSFTAFETIPTKTDEEKAKVPLNNWLWGISDTVWAATRNAMADAVKYQYSKGRQVDGDNKGDYDSWMSDGHGVNGWWHVKLENAPDNYNSQEYRNRFTVMVSMFPEMAFVLDSVFAQEYYFQSSRAIGEWFEYDGRTYQVMWEQIRSYETVANYPSDSLPGITTASQHPDERLNGDETAKHIFRYAYAKYSQDNRWAGLTLGIPQSEYAEAVGDKTRAQYYVGPQGNAYLLTTTDLIAAAPTDMTTDDYGTGMAASYYVITGAMADVIKNTTNFFSKSGDLVSYSADKVVFANGELTAEGFTAYAAESAAAVDAKIEALPAAADIQAFHKSDVESVREAYNELSEDAQALVTKLSVLEAAEAAITNIYTNHPAAAVELVLAIHNGPEASLLGSVKSTIEGYRAAYTAMDAAAQACVTNVDELEAMEQGLATVTANFKSTIDTWVASHSTYTNTGSNTVPWMRSSLIGTEGMSATATAIGDEAYYQWMERNLYIGFNSNTGYDIWDGFCVGTDAKPNDNLGNPWGDSRQVAFVEAAFPGMAFTNGYYFSSKIDRNEPTLSNTFTYNGRVYQQFWGFVTSYDASVEIVDKSTNVDYKREDFYPGKGAANENSFRYAYAKYNQDNKWSGGYLGLVNSNVATSGNYAYQAVLSDDTSAVLLNTTEKMAAITLGTADAGYIDQLAANAATVVTGDLADAFIAVSDADREKAGDLVSVSDTEIVFQYGKLTAAGLEIDGADYAAVDAALEKVAAMTKDDYTEASWAKLQTAVDAVVRGLKAYDQATVDGYAVAIEDAMLLLVSKAAEMQLTIDAGMVVSNSTNTDRYDITWNAHVLLNDDKIADDINAAGVKFKNYGVYYATGADVLADYKNASADQIRKIVFAQGENVDIYTSYGFRLKNVVENRVRAAMFYIEYELNGQNYILLSTVDEVVAVIAA